LKIQGNLLHTNLNMPKPVTQSLASEVLTLHKRGTAPHLIKKFISKKTGWKRTKSAEIYNDIVSGVSVAFAAPAVEDAKDPHFWEENIETLEKPYFNTENKQYVVFLNAIGRNMVVSEEKHRSILQMYSNWDGDERTIGQICRNVQWPRPVLIEYLKKFNLTHDSLPVTDEELTTQSDDELLGRLKELRKFSLHQKFEKESWDNIRADAAKWRAFEYKQYGPFLDFLEKYEPKPIKPLPCKYDGRGGDRTMLIGLSDVHYGSHVHPRYIYNDKHSKDGGWSIEHTKEAVDNYFLQIKEEVGSRKYKFEKAILCSLGDIIHGINGFTEKGQKLETFPLGQEQYDGAFDSLTHFIARTLEVFNKCEVHSVAGNHSLLDTILFKALAAYFRTDDRVTFNIYDSQHAMFKVYNTLFVMEHGASPYFKAKLPSTKTARKSYIQDLFLSHPEKLVGAKTKVFLSADQHHFEACEMGDIEQYMFSTLVGADKYADHNGWKNNPRQNCLVVDKDGVKEILNFYLGAK
jgi:hypothetical protein